MKPFKTDLLNILLILISLYVAFKIPFELFLFSYAVLGPLHYLTEISWLNSKNYFIQNQKWFWVLVAIAMIITIPFLLGQTGLASLQRHFLVAKVFNVLSDQSYLGIFLALTFSIVLINFKKNRHLVIGLFSCLAIGYLSLTHTSLSAILIGVLVFVPTLIHVYIFTLLFMIFGTLKKRTGAGVAAILLLGISPVFIYYSTVPADSYFISEYTKSNFIGSHFNLLTERIAKGIGAVGAEQFDFLSVIGLKIQIFIAFCYTYHYLNWFSKTNIIGWNKNISRTKLGVIVMLWAASVCLYWYDFKTGFSFLFFLSLLHVLLEFPLNMKSISGIYTSMFKKQTALQELPEQNQRL